MKYCEENMLPEWVNTKRQADTKIASTKPP